MILSTAGSARDFGGQLAQAVTARQPSEAYTLLAPVLSERTPFRLLDLAGTALAKSPTAKLDAFLEEIASHGTLGGWTVIAAALQSRVNADLVGTLEITRAFIVQADAWYACDCFGERVLGFALVHYFHESLTRFSPWRGDENRWVRRSLGVAGHLWAKRAKGSVSLQPQAAELMAFYQPMLAETQVDAAKGVGWALKTLGRYYPEAAFEFLTTNLNTGTNTAIRRKALKFLPAEMKAKLAP